MNGRLFCFCIIGCQNLTLNKPRLSVYCPLSGASWVESVPTGRSRRDRLFLRRQPNRVTGGRVCPNTQSLPQHASSWLPCGNPLGFGLSQLPSWMPTAFMGQILDGIPNWEDVECSPFAAYARLESGTRFIGFHACDDLFRG